jgi:hypothetical protein
MERYFACAGCRGLEKLVEAQAVRPPEKETAAAAHGTLLHDANESGDTSELSFGDEEQLVRIRQSEEAYTRQWCLDHNIDFNTITVIREKRLFITYPNGRTCSAKLDTLVLADGGHMLVIDAKSGRKGATPPIRNQQLRTCVAVAAPAYKIKTARVAIANLWGRMDPPCDYDESDIAQIHTLLADRLDYIEQPDLPTTAGPHCDFCSAKAICPSQREQMQVAISNRTLRWDLVSPEQKKPLFLAAKMAIAAGNAILDQLKADLKNDPAAAPGLLKRPDGDTRKITNTVEAWKAIKLAYYGPVDDPDLEDLKVLTEFLSACSISLADFTTFYRDKTGASKKEEEIFIATKCENFISRNPRSGSVEVLK